MNRSIRNIIFCSIIILFTILLFKAYNSSFNRKNKNESINEKTEQEQIERISYYNNPIVPKGFKKVETELATWKLKDGIPQGWNDGLVIEDEKENQFVWVPVDIENTNYEDREIKYGYVYDKNSMDYRKKEDLQILKYGGFYVGRYEAGISEEMQTNITEFDKKTNNTDGIPRSKKGTIVWNFIDWNNAKNNSIRMYQNEFTESDLITIKQWNSIIYWLEKKGYNTNNSIEYGNYSNNNFEFSGYYSIDYGKTYNYADNKTKQTYNMILSTGASERNKTNNIYDLAGNVSEFVDVHKYIDERYGEQEIYRNRGGYYDNISHIGVKSDMSISDANSRQGFRVVLYIK